MKQLFFVILVIISAQLARAQEGWESGGWVGTAHYFGDLNTNFDLTKPGLAAGVVFRYNFNERVCLKFGGSFGQISADDADSDNIFEQARNLSFQSNVWDGTAQFEFNFLPYVHGSKNEFFSPYLFAGMSVYNFNPMTEYQGELVELRPLGTEGQFRGEEYYSTQAALAYGGGIKLSLGYYWSINVEISARKLFTDYLDDVSTIYPDPDDVENFRGPLAAALTDRSIDLPGVEERFGPGRQRGNEFNNDAFVISSVSVLYYFGDLRCPKILRK